MYASSVTFHVSPSSVAKSFLFYNETLLQELRAISEITIRIERFENTIRRISGSNDENSTLGAIVFAMKPCKLYNSNIIQSNQNENSSLGNPDLQFSQYNMVKTTISSFCNLKTVFPRGDFSSSWKLC